MNRMQRSQSGRSDSSASYGPTQNRGRGQSPVRVLPFTVVPIDSGAATPGIDLQVSLSIESSNMEVSGQQLEPNVVMR